MKIILIEQQFKKIIEGIGDIYAYNKFKIEPEFSEFERKYLENIEKPEIVFRNSEITIIKNPKTLKNIGPYVRGIIDNDGNLYTEQKMKVIHKTILAILEYKKILNIEKYWQVKLPTDFITVQRIGKSNTYAIGESSYPMRTPEERVATSHLKTDWNGIPKYEDAYPIFKEFIDKAKLKNPDINFINEIIETRF